MLIIFFKVFHYLDNRWVTTENLKISAFDLAVTRGFGVFDFLLTYNRQPFLLKDHLDRFFNSAKFLNLEIPKKRKEIEKIIFEGIKKNPGGELGIKIILTGGESKDGVTPNGKGSLIVSFTPAVEYPKKFYQRGVKVITVRGQRYLPQAKYLNYTLAVLAMREAKDKGAIEAVYVDKKGRITEATRANFFAVVGKRLVTPKNGVLFGITRKVVLELASKLKISTVEKDIFISQIKDFDEAFITSSTKGIMPVVQIDDKKISNGKVGEVTKKLMRGFINLTRGKSDF